MVFFCSWISFRVCSAHTVPYRYRQFFLRLWSVSVQHRVHQSQTVKDVFPFNNDYIPIIQGILHYQWTFRKPKTSLETKYPSLVIPTMRGSSYLAPQRVESSKTATKANEPISRLLVFHHGLLGVVL